MELPPARIAPTEEMFTIAASPVALRCGAAARHIR